MKRVTTGLLIVILIIFSVISDVYANPQESFTKAESLYFAKGVEKDYKQAFKLYGLAAEAGIADAQAMLSYYYYNGLGAVVISKDLAFQYAKKASDKNSLFGTYLLAEFYFMGIGTTKDINKSKELYSSIASNMTAESNKGSILYQGNLGMMFALGLGVTSDAEKALKLLLYAATNGEVDAQWNLGQVYFYMLGDLKEALYWFHKAAEQGAETAQSKIAKIYMDGEGVPKDDVEALKWVRMAAEQGGEAAQNNLGVMYLTGRGGLMQNDTEAAKWFLKSAEQGYALAQYTLGTLYYNGRGLVKERDAVEAVKWIRKAAEQGFVNAQYALGLFIENGWGVTVDKAEAVKWYRMAAAQGDVNAQKALDRLSKQ